MRSFVAIPLPFDLSEDIEKLQAALPVGRLMPPENLHVTLAFLDDVDQGDLAQLHDDLSELVLTAPEIRLQGLDLFGGRKPRLLVARVAANEALSILHGRVLSCVRNAGITLKREKFRPHVTLARFAHRMASGDQARLGGFLQAHAGVGWAGFMATEFALYGSTLRPEGAVHEVLASYPLGLGNDWGMRG